MTVTLRPLTLDDVEQIVEILTEAEELEPSDQHFDVAELREEFVGPEIDLERGSLGLVDDNGTLLGFGYLMMLTPSDQWRAYVMGGVRTASLEQGHGRRLIEGLATRAAAIRDTDHPELPGELKLWVPNRRPRFDRLAERLGFEFRRYFQDMRHELQELPPVESPAGIELLAWDADLSEQVRVASNESFADHFGSSPMDEPHWRSLITDSTQFRPGVSVLARDEAGIVGFVLVEEFEAETKARGFRTAYIARVGTTKRARGRGVASAMLARTLQGLAADGYRWTELNVDSESPTGANRLYTRLGFVPTTHNIQRGRALESR